MLSSKNRLSDRALIQKLSAKGRLQKGDCFTFRFEAIPEAPSQFVVVISKKIDKRATVRNRLRRQTAAAIATHLDLLPSPFLMMFVARPKIKTADFQIIQQEVERFFSKISPHAK